MKKDIEWLKAEVWKQDTVMDKGYIYTDDLMSIINEVDEPEVLSQEWISDHIVFNEKDDAEYIYADKLQNLLVPKQEELESKIKVLIEAYKQEEDAYSNPENGWISGFIEDLKNLVEEEQKYYALIKGHELTDSYNVYWNYDKFDCSVFVTRLHPLHDNFITEMSKSEWNELGINDSNADLIKVEEIGE